MAHSHSPFAQSHMSPLLSGGAVGTASSDPPDITLLPSTVHQTTSKSELTSHETHPVISSPFLAASINQNRLVKDSSEAKGRALALAGSTETPSPSFCSMDVPSIFPPKDLPFEHDNTTTLSHRDNSPSVSIDFWRHDVIEFKPKDLETFDNKAKEVHFINEDNIVYESLSTNSIIAPTFNCPVVITTPHPSLMGADLNSSAVTEVARPAYMNEDQMKTTPQCPSNAMEKSHQTGMAMFDGNQKHGPTKPVHVANIFTLRSTACDDETVSPKEAFLDFEHVSTKLEGQAVRRARHSKLNTIVAELNDRKQCSGHNGTLLTHSETPWISPATANSTLSCPNMLWTKDSMKTEAATTSNSKSSEPPTKRYRNNTSTCSLPPPQCVPKNAMRWTSSHASKAFAAPESYPQSSTRISPLLERDSEDNKCVDSSQKLNLEAKRKTDHPTYIEPESKSSAGKQSQEKSEHRFCSFGTAVEEAENFSASSEDEISPLEVDMAVLEGIMENAQKPFRSFSASINNQGPDSGISFNSTSLLSLETAQGTIFDTDLKQLATPPSGSESSRNSSQQDATLSPIGSHESRAIDTVHWFQSSNSPSLNDTNPPSNGSLVNYGDGRRLDSDSELENSIPPKIRKIGKGKEKQTENQTALCGSLKSCQNHETIDVAKTALPSVLGETPVHERKISFDVSTDTKQKNFAASERHDESRTTSSPHITLLSAKSELDSRFANGGLHSSENEITEYLDPGVDLPYTAPRRTTRRTSFKTAGKHSGPLQPARKADTSYTGALRKLTPRYTSNRRGSQSRASNPPETSSSNTPSTGPIQCGYVDKKTGERCETVFKRPYDLARHKETIHDTEGPEGDRKPQWTCDQCGGGFSRKDALMRHCRIRDHKAAVSKS